MTTKNKLESCWRFDSAPRHTLFSSRVRHFEKSKTKENANFGKKFVMSLIGREVAPLYACDRDKESIA